jgi:hypothetical protein
MKRTVKIKTWEAMEKEFGLFGGGINCKHGFTDKMEELIPESRIIALNGSRAEFGGMRWSISDNMIEMEIQEGLAGVHRMFNEWSQSEKIIDLNDFYVLEIQSDGVRMQGEMSNELLRKLYLYPSEVSDIGYIDFRITCITTMGSFNLKITLA